MLGNKKSPQRSAIASKKGTQESSLILPLPSCLISNKASGLFIIILSKFLNPPTSIYFDSQYLGSSPSSRILINSAVSSLAYLFFLAFNSSLTQLSDGLSKMLILLCTSTNLVIHLPLYNLSSPAHKIPSMAPYSFQNKIQNVLFVGFCLTF